jgi:hypothetical protein
MPSIGLVERLAGDTILLASNSKGEFGQLIVQISTTANISLTIVVNPRLTDLL